jgi:hypothetical protein
MALGVAQGRGTPELEGGKPSPETPSERGANQEAEQSRAQAPTRCEKSAEATVAALSERRND